MPRSASKDAVAEDDCDEIGKDDCTESEDEDARDDSEEEELTGNVCGNGSWICKTEGANGNSGSCASQLGYRKLWVVRASVVSISA